MEGWGQQPWDHRRRTKKDTKAGVQSRLSMVVAESAKLGGTQACAGDMGGGRGKGATANKMGHGCNDVQPAAIPRGDWDTLRRVLKTKRISKQAEKVGAETSGGRTGGCQTGGAGPYSGIRDIKAVVVRRRVRSQQQHIRTKVGNRTTCSQGRSVRRGHFGGSHIRVALGQVESVSGLVAAWL
jgi:hypothetical protein